METKSPGREGGFIVGQTASVMLLVAAVSCLTALPIAAKEIPYEWSDVPRIVAIGDIHGAMTTLLRCSRTRDWSTKTFDG